jgi:hypothetical protein
MSHHRRSSRPRGCYASVRNGQTPGGPQKPGVSHPPDCAGKLVGELKTGLVGARRGQVERPVRRPRPHLRRQRAGRRSSPSTDPRATVVNQGTITVAQGGLASLASWMSPTFISARGSARTRASSKLAMKIVSSGPVTSENGFRCQIRLVIILPMGDNAAMRSFAGEIALDAD